MKEKEFSYLCKKCARKKPQMLAEGNMLAEGKIVLAEGNMLNAGQTTLF